MQVEAELKQLNSLITAKQYYNVNKTSRSKYQKTHEVKFYKDNIDYEKGLQLLFLVQTNVEENNINLLRLKGDIMW